MFDVRWEQWLDAAESWIPFFESVAALKDFDVANALKTLSLVESSDLDAVGKLKVNAGGKGVRAPGPFEPGNKSVALLAPGFGRGAKSGLLVPYSPLREA